MRLFAFPVPLACLFLVFAQLTGCGGSDSSSEDSSAESETTGAANTEAAESSPAAGMESSQAGSGMEQSGPPGGGDNAEAGMASTMASTMESGMGQGMGSSGPPGGYESGDMAGSDPAMMSEMAMAEGYGGAPGNGAGPGSPGGQMQGKPRRPQDVRQWSDEDFLAAVTEKDSTVVHAIQVRADMSAGDPQFPQLMSDMLAQSSGEMPGGMGGPGMGPGAGGLPFSLPGLFGGGGQDAAMPPPTAVPRPTRQTGKPPGGASLDPTLIRPARESKVIDSLEYMIGQSLLSYVPQATQNIRNAGTNIQQSVNGSNPNSAAGNSSQMTLPNNGAAQGKQIGQGQYSSQGNVGGAANMSSEMMSAEDMTSGYPGANAGAYEQGGGNGGYGQNPTAGTLDDRALIEAIVGGLVRNNTPQAWKMIDGIAKGSVRTPLPPEANTEIVVRNVFSAAEPNLAMAESLLNSALNAALQNPTQNGGTLRLLAAINRSPADHFLDLGGNQPLPPPAGNSPNGFSGQPGMQGSGQPGLQGSGQPGLQGSGQPQMSSYQAASGQAGQPQMNGQPGATGTAPNMAATGSGYAGAAYTNVPGNGPGNPQMMMQENENYADGTGNSLQNGAAGQGFGMQQNFPQQMMAPQLQINVAEAAMLPVAKALWAPSTASQIASFLQAESSTESAKDLLAFASTIPSDEVRRATYSLLSKSHSQGASALIQSGLFRDFARDPGMLTVLKSLPRQRPNPAAQGAAAPAGPGDSWVQATQDAVLSLRDRLVSVADNPELAFTGVTPVRLHKNAVPDRSIRIVMPGKTAESLGDAVPAETKVYYSRVTVTPQRAKDMQDVVDHYEKRTKAYKREDRARGILWYDGVKLNTNGTRQSMDIVIEQAGNRPAANNGFGGPPGGGGAGYEGGAGGTGGYPGAGPQGGGNAVQYIVEVIVVVTKDPAKSADAAVTTAAR